MDKFRPSPIMIFSIYKHRLYSRQDKVLYLAFSEERKEDGNLRRELSLDFFSKAQTLNTLHFRGAITGCQPKNTSAKEFFPKNFAQWI